MVHLRKILQQNREELSQHKNIELAAYLYLQSFEDIANYTFDLSPEEEVSFFGYKKEFVELDLIHSIINKQRWSHLFEQLKAYL